MCDLRLDIGTEQLVEETVVLSLSEALRQSGYTLELQNLARTPFVAEYSVCTEVLRFQTGLPQFPPTATATRVAIAGLMELVATHLTTRTSLSTYNTAAFKVTAQADERELCRIMFWCKLYRTLDKQL
jgi:hypothetical protein